MGKTAFLYPGQGVQKIGMGKDFYDREEVSRNVIDKASKLLHLDMAMIEIGPGKTLTGFIKRINREVKVYNIETWDDMERTAGELLTQA